MQTPGRIFSSMRKMCLPGNPLALPVPGRSRMKVVCENGRYWYALVPFPALKPTKAGVPPWPSVVSPPALKKVFVGYCLLFAVISG
jgi:hypothetical protein